MGAKSGLYGWRNIASPSFTNGFSRSPTWHAAVHYHAREGETSYIFSLLALPNSVQGSNICLSVCCSFLCNTDYSHLLHVLEDSYHNYSTEEAVLNFSYDSTPWTAVSFPTESDESVSSPVHFQKSHPYKYLANNPAAVGFFCSGLGCCGTNHEDFCVSQVLNYHVHTSSLIPSCNHDSPQVTRRSEFYQDIVSCKGWVGPHAVWFFIQVGFSPF